MHMEMVYWYRVLMLDDNHIEFCQLPEKYDIDLEQLRAGLRSVNAFDFERPLWFNLPRNGRTARAMLRNDAPIHIEGYSGICFKSEKGKENDLYQGLAYDGIQESSNVAGPSDVGIDSTFTERNDMWFPYLTEIESKFKGQVTQMRLLKLHARHNLGRKMHTDYPWYKGLRLHIPLTDDLIYKWRVMKTIYEVHGADGHMYYLNVGKLHMPMNDHSDIDRWVFNVNIIPHTLEIPLHEQIKQEIL